jgi:hypothetical protein
MFELLSRHNHNFVGSACNKFRKTVIVYIIAEDHSAKFTAPLLGKLDPASK